MTRVDFYILADSSEQARAQFVCRLTEKVYGLGNSVYVHTESAAAAKQLDEQLWQFKAEGFVPHAVEDDLPTDEVQVIIGYNEEIRAPLTKREVLINLAPTVPLFFSSFERVAEVIEQSGPQKEAGRERYRFYRDRGYTMETHKLG